MTQRGFSADVSVRPSLPEDAPRVGEIQVAAWRHAALLPAEALAGLDPAAFAAAWGEAITSPPSAKHRLLTALDGPALVGFAALAPAAERTGEIVTLEVDPAYHRKGHGSRLLAACTDVLRATAASHVRTWVLAEDTDRAAFFTAAGFAPLGVGRSEDAPGAVRTEDTFGSEFDRPSPRLLWCPWLFV